jgi:PKD repeat protein
MKANITNHFIRLSKLIVLAMGMIVSSIVNAQTSTPAAAFQGGRTYWVNGVGLDYVLPKDTFMNLTGAHLQDSVFIQTTGLLTAFNNQGVDPTTLDTIKFILAPGYTGVEADVINIGRTTGNGGYPFQTAQRPVVIRPAAGFNVNITTSLPLTSNSSVIRFNGAQYVTIDGAGTVGQRNLTVTAPAHTGMSGVRVIDIRTFSAGGCRFLTIKNCRIVGNSSAASPGPAAVNTYAGIYSGGTAGSPSNATLTSQNITITNNVIEAVQNGIFMNGVQDKAGRQDNALTITNNTIGGTVQPFGAETNPTTYVGGANGTGITLISQKNAVVSGNTIRNNIPTGANFRAIQLSSTGTNVAMDSAITINANKIYNIKGSGASGVYGIRMTFLAHTQPVAITLSNNTIGDMLGSTTGTALSGQTNIVGIMVEDGTSNMGLNVYHNSVHLYGDTLNNGAISACFLTSSTVTGGIRVVNNIFVNRLGRSMNVSSNTTSVSYIYAIGAGVNPFTQIANNAYYVNNTSGAWSFIGNLGASNKATMKTWSLVTNDNSSVTAIPPFVGSSNDLCVINNGAASTLGNYGISTGITTDINGNTRSTSSPSLGAYEFTGNSAIANYSLKGGSTYQITGTSSWPVGPTGTGTFATLADAVTYVNTYGLSGTGNVTLRFTSTYTGETAFIPHLLNYNGASASRILMIDVAAGANVTVSAPSNVFPSTQYALFNMIGAKYVSINGSSTAGQRNLTFAMPQTFVGTTIHVIGLETMESDSISDISIANCQIVGASNTTTLFTASGIYHGGYNATTGFISANTGSSKNINISGNAIRAVKNGIYLRGANIFSGQTRNVTVYRNIIGGNVPQGQATPMTFIGGAGSIAGIYVKGISMSLIDSNVVRNCDSVGNGSNGFRGIDLDLGGEQNAIDSAITISRNTIYNLTTVAGTYTAGIRVNMGSTGSRGFKIINNSIGKIRGTGQQPAAVNTNPTGILIDASGTVANLDLDILHNTVNMNGMTLTGSNSSAAVFISASIQGGVRLQNNILNNRLGRVTPVAGSTSYALYAGASSAALSPFALANQGLANSNTYGADAPNTANNYVVGAGASNFFFVKQWQTYINSDLNSIGFNAFFANDTTPVVDPRYAGVLYNGVISMLAVTKDITGATRPLPMTCAGALQFALDYLPLAGDQTYLINGIDNLPRTSGTAPFSFRTVTDAFNYLNTNGVDGLSPDVKRVTLKISAGYVGEPVDTFIPAIRQYPRANSTRIVSLTTSAGRSDTLRTSATLPYQANGSVIRFLGCSNFEIDGNNGTGRGITIALPNVANVNAASLKLIDIAPADVPVTNIQIRNCNLIGTSSSNSISTYAGIYMGGITATPSVPVSGSNSNHVFENNLIVAVRYGIYAQGLATAPGIQDKGVAIKRNIIGSSATYAGNTLNWGGATPAAGIFLAAQANTLVDSNVISNNMNTFATNRGIELSSPNIAAQAVDSGITVSRNTITGISNLTAGGAAYGIYMSFADTITPKNDRGFTLKNNMISNITAPGTTASPATAYSFSSPIGIYVEGTVATAPINNMGLRVWSNSINLGYGTQDTVTGSVSACIAFSPLVRGGVSMQNNIFQNRLGRATSTGTATAVLVGHTSTIFTLSSNNIYFTNAPSSTNTLMISSSTLASPVVYNTIPTIQGFTRQDSMSLNFITNFVNETNLLLNGTSHNAYAWGALLPTVTNDLQGDSRNPSLRPTIGADEIPFGALIDSIAPRIYDVTKLPLFCNSGSAIPVSFRVFERATAVASDTLYYSVNNTAEQFVVGGVLTNEFTRTYNIPPQADNASIAYRLAVRDNSSQAFRTVLPATGYNYTSTSFNTFPITYGFDLPNVGGWTVDNNTTGTPAPGGWDLNTFGSGLNPTVLPKTGLKAALFPASTLPDGSISRLVSPCLDFTNMKVPTVRIWVSQNAETANRGDSVQVVVSGGFNIWSSPRGIVNRVNTSLVFPEFKQLDVCLSDFAGLNGMRIGIEGISKNGMNIVLDSIVIFDDVLNQPVTPLTSTICAYNPLSLNIPASSDIYRYTMVDVRNGLPLGASVNGNTNGSALNVTAPNPSNPAIARIDSVRAIIQYTNTVSGCVWQMPDTAKIFIKNFYGGPFMNQGTPFSGVFGVGSFAKPDGTKLGDTLTYSIAPPSGLTNADYGTKWTVVGVNIATPIEGRPFANYTYTAATPSTNAFITAKPSNADLDSTFKISATLRFLPSGCDTVVVRYLKVTSAPTASFTSASDSVCSGAAIYFTNTTTAFANTYPLTYFWTFGDGTTASTGDANKIYAFDKAPGLYTVTLKATNNTGVFSTATKTIRVLPAPLTTYTSGLACGTDPIAFTNTTATAVKYLWTVRLNNQVKDTSTQVNPTFSFAIPDTAYAVTLRSTNSLGCFRDSTRTVFAFAKPVPAFTTVNQCAGTNVAFVNTSTISPGGSNRVNTFGSFWDFGNGDIGLSNSPVYKYPAKGTYTVKLKVTSNYGCTDSTTRSVTIYEKPITGFTTGIACQGSVVTINNTTTFSGGTGQVKFAWDFGDFSPISNDPNPVKTYGGLGNFTIQLVAHDTVNNCYDTTSHPIEVNEVPFAVFASTNGCVNTPIDFSNGSIPPIGQTLTYAWTFGDGGTSTATNPSHPYAGAGKFGVTLKATTNKGCSDDAADSVTIETVPQANFSWDTLGLTTVYFVPAVKGLSNYRWDFGDSTKMNANDDTVQNTYQVKGAHRVTLTVTSINGCTGSHTEDSVMTYWTIGFEELFAAKFNLSVYPNPFNEATNISYNLASKQNVTITVMDVLGRKVSEVVENNQMTGNHVIRLDESKFAASGVYMVRIQIGDEAVTKQLIRQ